MRLNASKNSIVVDVSDRQFIRIREVIVGEVADRVTIGLTTVPHSEGGFWS